MFELSKEKGQLDAGRERIVMLAMSFNEPQIVASGHRVQPAHAYICTLEENEGFSVNIYLYLTVDKTGLLYVNTGTTLTPDECRSAEDEAMQFTEEMGFMIDDIRFSSLNISQQNKLLATIPMFAQAGKFEAGEKILEEEIIEAIEPVDDEGKDWNPDTFLSKFRMRAAEERAKKETR